MQIDYSRPNLTTRFIAAGRVVMVAFSFIAVLIHPTTPVNNALIVDSIMIWYLIYATVLVVALWYILDPWPYLNLVIHAIDLIVISLLMYFSAGPASPFFVFIVFALVCATLRWQWRGTLYTGIIVIAIVCIMALYPENLLRNPEFEMNRFIIRIGYIPVVSILLGYLSAYEQAAKLSAANQVRIQLYQDLHNGLLQALSVMAMQLEAARHLIEEDLQTARQSIADVQQLIYDEQQDLRDQIQELKTPAIILPKSKEDLIGRLNDFAKRIERQWGLRVEFDIKLDRKRLPGNLMREAYLILHEAIINAARHAKASSIRAQIIGGQKSLRIVITDDGSGFSFRGRYNQSALAARKLGPMLLMQKVESLGGKLTVESGDTGASLEIDLPIMA